MTKNILKKVKKRDISIGIIGLGYVGLPLVKVCLEKDFKVYGFDIDDKKIKMLKEGKSYLKHLNHDFIKKYYDKGKFLPTSDFKDLEKVGYILICVPTPVDNHRNPDLSFIISTTEKIKKYLRKGQVIILESTTYPGTTDGIMKPILEKSGLTAGKDFFLGYSPEREDPGNKKFTAEKIPKIVSGINKESLNLIKALYGNIITEIIPVSSTRVAEATKILENTYRAVNIALVNELKMIFDKMEIDIWEVIKAAKTKPFGFKAFYPGPGLGGHCIPIDPFYLTYIAREYDYNTRFIELAGQINTYQPYYVRLKIIEVLNKYKKNLNGSKILILGIAYKKDVDDVRESPAFKIMELLSKDGSKIDYYDPLVPATGPHRHYPKLKMESIKYSPEKIREYDLILLVTDHSELSYDEILENANIIVDTRNVFKDHKKVFRA